MRDRRGFTIIELMVGAGLVGLLVAVFFFGYYRSGFYREYILSQEARQLVATLNSARQRAMASAFSESATFRPTDNRPLCK